jgi:transcriptional regulator with XRE-family HTH domain
VVTQGRLEAEATAFNMWLTIAWTRKTWWLVRGSNLRLLRRATGNLTQRELARRAGVSLRTVQRLERGDHRRVRFATGERLAFVLCVIPSWLCESLELAELVQHRQNWRELHARNRRPRAYWTPGTSSPATRVTQTVLHPAGNPSGTGRTVKDPACV